MFYSNDDGLHYDKFAVFYNKDIDHTSMHQVYTTEVSKENMNWNIIDVKDATMKRNVFKVVNGKYIYLFNGDDKTINVYTFMPRGNNITLCKSIIDVDMPLNEFVMIIHLL